MSAPTTEASIQATLKHALESLGYIVLEVSKGRSASAKGAWIGTTPGTPDLFVSHADWGMPVWIGIEMKTKAGRVRPEQQAMADKGLTVIARSVEEGLRFVIAQEWIWFASRDVVTVTNSKRYKALCKMCAEFGGWA